MERPESAQRPPSRRARSWFVAIVSLGALALCLHTALVKRPPNYRVVTQAASRITGGENPYGAELGLDRFKYSPLAGLLVAPFAVLPESLGLFLFLLVQCLVFFWAFRRWCAAASYPLWSSPALPWVALASVGLDFATAIQNAQVNVAILALMFLGGAQYAESKPARSGLVLSFATNLKLFPFTLALCLLTGGKSRYWLSFLGGTLLWLFLPAALLGLGRDLELHRQWTALMSRDEARERAMLDIGSFLELHFGVDAAIRSPLALAAGFVIGVGCFIVFRRGERRRLHRFLVPINGLYVLLFSYLSESPTSILAVGAIFLIGARAAGTQRSRSIHWFAWVLALVLVPLFYSDLAPSGVQAWSRANHLKTIGYLYLAALTVVLFFEYGKDPDRESAPRR